jgi:hypothetical protein
MCFSRSSIVFISSILCLFVYTGCGGSSNSSNSPEDLGPTSNGKFSYEPGEPGVVTGLTAEATLDSRSETVTSDQVEIQLRAPGNTTVTQQLETSTGRLTFGTSTQTLGQQHSDANEWTTDIEKTFLDQQRAIQQAFSHSTSASHTAGARTAVQQQSNCDGLPTGRATREMGTWDGWSCSTDWTGSAGGGGLVQNYAWVVHYAPEGVYFTLQRGKSVYFPPDIANASKTTSLTCVKTPDRGNMTVGFVDNLRGLSFSVDVGIGPIGISFSYGVVINNATGQPVGMSFGRGVSISSGFFMGPFSLPFGFSADGPDGHITTLKEGDNPGYFVYVGPKEPCSSNSSQGLAAQGLEQDNPLAGISAMMNEQNQPPASRRDATYQASQTNVAPLFNVIGSPTGTGPAQHIPAATNADTFADFFARDNQCTGCPDTSLAYINERVAELWNDAGSNSERAQIGYAAVSKARESLPQIGLQEQLQRRARQSIGLAFESIVSGEGENDYFASNVVNLTAPLGEAVEFEISAQEIADLVGASPADIEGAEVCLEQSLNIEADPICQTVSGGSVGGSFTPSDPTPLTLIPTVDLTSASGSFGGADVSQWTVKPAIRVFTPVPNENAELALALDGPNSIVSGGVASLNAMLVDNNGVPLDLDGTVTLKDVDGNTLTTGELQYGTATLQFQPTPTTPVVDSFVQTQINFKDGSSTFGYMLSGQGISRLGTIRIDGNAIVTDPEASPDAGYRFQLAYNGNDQVALIPREMSDRLDSGEHTVTVEHPGGQTSEPLSFTL